mgnify:CR=1 FL=1
MKGSWILIWIFIIAGISLALFQVEQKVQQREEELAQLNQQILKDQEALHVLKAEWSYLNQPSRLEGLNDKFLSLAPVTGWQIAKIGDLPFRSPAEAVQDNLKHIFAEVLDTSGLTGSLNLSTNAMPMPAPADAPMPRKEERDV